MKKVSNLSKSNCPPLQDEEWQEIKQMFKKTDKKFQETNKKFIWV